MMKPTIVASDIWYQSATTSGNHVVRMLAVTITGVTTLFLNVYVNVSAMLT